jgi:hypothetical protein
MITYLMEIPQNALGGLKTRIGPWTSARMGSSVATKRPKCAVGIRPRILSAGELCHKSTLNANTSLALTNWYEVVPWTEHLPHVGVEVKGEYSG